MENPYLGRICGNLGHFRRLDDFCVSIVEQHVVFVYEKDLLRTTSARHKDRKKCYIYRLVSEERNVKFTGTQSSLHRSWLGVRLDRLPFVKIALTLAGYFLPSAHVASIRSPTENSLIFVSLQVRNLLITYANGERERGVQRNGENCKWGLERGRGRKKYEYRVVGVSHIFPSLPQPFGGK